jgi:hypothetical protein
MSVQLDGERAGRLLARSIAAAFGDMAFIDAQTVSVDSGDDGMIRSGTPVPEGQRCAVIEALMPLSCRIEFVTETALRDRIIDTLFGDRDEAVQKKLADDSLLEMLNVVAGSFLSDYFGGDAQIQLELPRLLYLAEAPVGQTVARVVMDAEGTPLTARITSVRYRY